jgi:hypothetical protein
MESVFINVGLNGRDLGDLMPHRAGVVAVKRGTTATAAGRLDLERISQSFGWDQRSGVAFVTGLAAPLPPRRWERRSPLDLHGGWI